MATPPKPLTEWQADNTPPTLPRHIRRNISEGAGGCWLWTRSLSRDGYGWASLDNRTHQAHRLVYRLLIGPVDPSFVLDHLCRVRHCVNPEHLEPVTPRENLRRGDTPTGWSSCRTCGSSFASTGTQRRCLPCQERYQLERRPLKAAGERERRALLKRAAS